MRHWPGIAIAVALAAIAPQSLVAVIAGGTSVLFEALPYFAVGAALAPLIGRYAHAVVAYAGCGCGAGPSARSIPAAVATAGIFGVPAAVTRVVAAALMSRMVTAHDHATSHVDLLGDVVALVPAALLAAVIMLAVPSLPLRGVPPYVLFFGGAMLGLVASPCAFGGIALAASLHARVPPAAAGVLCTSGIFPNLWRRQTQRALHDPWAYGALAFGCALVAARHGGTFVHPRMTIPLVLTACTCVVLAWCFRARSAHTPRLVAFAALTAIVIGAPAPAYHITETTLADGFAGERVDFTGIAVAERGRSALVRYAITCCRADAAPVALTLDRDVSNVNGRWLRASGTLEPDGPQLRLHVERLAPITPPADPFIYR